MKQYTYAIIKESYPELERQSTLGDNNYSDKKKYAMIVKQVNNDSSESVSFIKYCDDLQKLQNDAETYISWYNYILGTVKNIQGYISEI